MKSTTAILLLALATTATAADLSNTPEGVTGPGVQITKRTTGYVIAVGSPITRAVPIGVECPNTSKSDEKHSVLNKGTAIGGVVGGVGTRLITKNKAAVAAGAIAGAAVGNEIDKRAEQRRSAPDANGCVSLLEMRIVGWNYTAHFPEDDVQVSGIMRRQPNIGEDVMIIKTSIIYPGE